MFQNSGKIKEKLGELSPEQKNFIEEKKLEGKFNVDQWLTFFNGLSELDRLADKQRLQTVRWLSLVIILHFMSSLMGVVFLDFHKIITIILGFIIAAIPVLALYLSGIKNRINEISTSTNKASMIIVFLTPFIFLKLHLPILLLTVVCLPIWVVLLIKYRKQCEIDIENSFRETFVPLIGEMQGKIAENSEILLKLDATYKTDNEKAIKSNGPGELFKSEPMETSFFLTDGSLLRCKITDFVEIVKHNTAKQSGSTHEIRHCIDVQLKAPASKYNLDEKDDYIIKTIEKGNDAFCIYAKKEYMTSDIEKPTQALHIVDTIQRCYEQLKAI